MTAFVKTCKYTVFSSGFFCQIYRVTDEALIAETAVWPNFFLINVFFALKGSKLFIIISNLDCNFYFGHQNTLLVQYFTTQLHIHEVSCQSLRFNSHSVSSLMTYSQLQNNHKRSNRKAMNRNWSNQKANPALEPIFNLILAGN